MEDGGVVDVEEGGERVQPRVRDALLGPQRVHSSVRERHV